MFGLVVTHVSSNWVALLTSREEGGKKLLSAKIKAFIISANETEDPNYFCIILL